MIRCQYVCLWVLTVCVAAGQGATPSFRGLGHLPGDIQSYANAVSADGKVVVGSSTNYPANTSQAFRWTEATGMVGLGDLPGGIFGSAAKGVSADGSVVVGRGAPASWYQAFRWTEAGGMVGLGYLAGGSYPESVATGVSADGSVVVGSSTSSPGSEPFLWNSTAGMVGLGGFESRYYGGANAVTPDGALVVGTCNHGQVDAYRWTKAGGMVAIGGSNSWGTAVSRDGSVVVGSTSSGHQAYRWTAAGGMVGLGDLAGGSFESQAFGVSGDGEIVVGYGSVDSGALAIIWDLQHGMRELKTVLTTECGLDLTGWRLGFATGISDDGRVIVGYGSGPQGGTEAWMAVIPEPTTLSLLALGGLAVIRRRRR